MNHYSRRQIPANTQLLIRQLSQEIHDANTKAAIWQYEVYLKTQNLDDTRKLGESSRMIWIIVIIGLLALGLAVLALGAMT